MRGWQALAAAAVIVAAATIAVKRTNAGSPPRAPAPEIRTSQWINSRPLTLAGLRGKVIAVEFWTFG